MSVAELQKFKTGMGATKTRLGVEDIPPSHIAPHAGGWKPIGRQRQTFGGPPQAKGRLDQEVKRSGRELGSELGQLSNRTTDETYGVQNTDFIFGMEHKKRFFETVRYGGQDEDVTCEKEDLKRRRKKSKVERCWSGKTDGVNVETNGAGRGMCNLSTEGSLEKCEHKQTLFENVKDGGNSWGSKQSILGKFKVCTQQVTSGKSDIGGKMQNSWFCFFCVVLV